ncbi:MAG: YabP/YqfC family sporulation protein [Bacilli bacterium]|nr:YabP/YqfC family sporulation protein [Bacilli bacterium]
MLKNIRSFCADSVFRVTVFEDKVDIINYIEIDHFDDTNIFIRYSDGRLIIKGEMLIISKLLDEEVLITGKVKSVEFR